MNPKKRGEPSISCSVAKRPRPNEPPNGNKLEKSEAIEWTNYEGVSINALPAEVLRNVFSFIDVRELPQMEQVGRNFQSGVHAAWRDLKTIDLDQLFDKKAVPKWAIERRKLLRSVMSTISTRSPMLQSVTFGKTLDAPCMTQLAAFPYLRSVNISFCCVQIRHLATFLSTSRNRAGLEELILVESLRFPNHLKPEEARDRRHRNDETLRAALADQNGRPRLRLKKLVYEGNNCCHGDFLAGLDASNLEVFSFVGNQIHNDGLISLLHRCGTELKELHAGAEFYKPIVVARDVITGSPSPFDDLAPNFIAINLPSSPNLNKFELSGEIGRNEYTWEVADSLKGLATKCPAIMELNFHRYYTFTDNDELVDAVAENFKNLEKLNLNVQACNARTITNVVTRMSGLKRLGLYYFSGPQRCSHSKVPQINADVIRAIVSHLTNLTSLYLHKPIVSADDLKLLSDLANLKAISVSGPSVKNDVVIAWCKSFGRRLECLELASSEVSDSSIATVAKDLPNLRRFAGNNSNITDISLRAIARACPCLETVSLAGCKKISAAGVQNLLNVCKKLTRLDLSGTSIRSDQIDRDSRISVLMKENRKKPYFCSESCIADYLLNG